MEKEEIKRQIEQKSQCIKELVDPCSFVLNPEVEKLQKEIEDLQFICPHSYKNGSCIYCYHVDKENK